MVVPMATGEAVMAVVVTVVVEADTRVAADSEDIRQSVDLNSYWQLRKPLLTHP